ncbi:substrate-binding domain-containing protein [Dissulfurispira sp.]|uniref:substrate-binding domain-containing protein n=1 Tax=Dissulfurispira sp. TaxID=2817609 RepID=UPI002FDAD80A
MKKVICALLAGMVLLLICSAGAFADEIRIGAGAAPAGILKTIKEYFEKTSAVKLTIVEVGPRIAMQDLLKDTIDVAGAGVTLDEWIAVMKKDGIEVNKAELQSFVIGKSRAAVFINKSNPVSRLTKEQLKGIFTGKITNWRDVGGKDMTIVIVWGKLTPGMNALFISKILDGESPTKDILEAVTGPDVKQNIASNQEAIGIVASNVVDDTIKVPEIPEVSSDIILVTKGKPSQRVQRLIDFIKGEGQKYIKQ